MKKYIVNIFATTGISLLLLAAVALASRAKCIYIQTLFQVFAANAIAHFGLFITSRLELKYAAVKALLDIALITFMLLMFGMIFNWFTSTPIWLLAIMGFVMYAISAILNLFRMKHEAQEINALIKKRNGRKAE